MNCFKKQIAMSNRHKQIGEKARFFKNNKGRWAFSPKFQQTNDVNQQTGVSNDDVKILHQLTQASMALVPNNK